MEDIARKEVTTPLNLERVILSGRESNAVLREEADNLYEIVRKLNGDFPREIHNYDEEKKQALAYLEMLEMNARYYSVIIEDIIYSVSNLRAAIN